MERAVIARYHYKESGLDTVWLRNCVVSYKCACGERLVEIPDIERLHDAIAYTLLQKPSLLHGKEFRFLRKWIGATAEQLRQKLGGVSRITVSRWENGKSSITAQTDHLMRLYVMRVKEDAVQRRMFEKIKIQEILEQMKRTGRKKLPITITKDNIRNLPFPLSRSTAKEVCV